VGGYGPLAPIAVVLHRTYGSWPGDYSVIRQGKLCQILIGKDEGRWVQFASTDQVHYHCNGANFRAFGIELEGTNEDPLTAWQEARLGDVLRYAFETYGIPPSYLDPASVDPASVWVNGGGYSGVISHASVRTDDGSGQHTDEVDATDYAAALGAPVPRVSQEDDEMLYMFGPNNTGAIWRVGDYRRLVNLNEWHAAQFKYANEHPGQVLVPFAYDQSWFDSVPTIPQGGGGGATVDVAAIAKAVNDDAAQRLAKV
jgi:hypothetical protein